MTRFGSRLPNQAAAVNGPTALWAESCQKGLKDLALYERGCHNHNHHSQFYEVGVSGPPVCLFTQVRGHGWVSWARSLCALGTAYLSHSG